MARALLHTCRMKGQIKRARCDQSLHCRTRIARKSTFPAAHGDVDALRLGSFVAARLRRRRHSSELAVLSCLPTLATVTQSPHRRSFHWWNSRRKRETVICIVPPLQTLERDRSIFESFVKKDGRVRESSWTCR